jgi:hypothetical protein
MNHFRGALMVLAAAVAFWRGAKIHAAGHSSLVACVLGVVALALAVWHFTRRPAPWSGFRGQGSGPGNDS